MAFQPTKDDAELVRFLAQFYSDPLGFVMAAYPWQKPGTILEDEEGPDVWQAEYLEELGKEVRECDRGEREVIQIATASGHGPGKYLRINELVFTPTGTKMIGDLKVGDVVLGGDGKHANVTGVFPQGEKALYRVIFSDGSNVLAGLEHLWVATTRADREKGKKPKVVNTLEMMQNIDKSYMIPMAGAAQFNERDVDIDPYVMGYILGNGSVCTPGAVKISCYDDDVYSKIETRLPDGYSLNGKTSDGHYKHISTGSYHNNYNVVYRTIKSYGLAGKKAWEKFIPDDYLYNSVKNRIELLRGLLDADGCISARKGRKDNWRCVFSTTSPIMRDQVVWIVQSLGGTMGRSADDRRGRKLEIKNRYNSTSKHINYQCWINLPNWIIPFSMKRKVDKYKQWLAGGKKQEPKRFVKKIEYAEDADACCISVDNPDSLYLTKDFIVTHNTALVAWIIHWFESTRIGAHLNVTANTQAQLLDKTWREVAKWKSLAINGHHFEWTATTYRFIPRKDSQYAMAIPWSEHSPEAIAGLHEKYVGVIFDEASGIANSIWESISGAMTTRGALWLVFGNMTRSSGRFFDCFHKERNRWKTFSVDSRTAKKANKKLFDQWIEDYGIDSDYVRVRVLGLPPKQASLQFIPTNIVNDALEREIELEAYQYAAKVLSVDVAREGDDDTVFICRQGLKLLWRKAFKGINLMETAQLTAKFEDEEKPDAVFVDAVGIGAGVIDRGRQLGRQWIEHKGSHKSSRREYANKRAECWGLMRLWLENADLTALEKEERQIVIDDLTGIEYSYDRVDRIMLEKKADMKARGLHSPDSGDAIAMSFTQTVIPKHQLDEDYDYAEAQMARRRADKSRSVITGY